MRNSSLTNYITILNYCLYAIISAKSISLVYYLSLQETGETLEQRDKAVEIINKSEESQGENKENTLASGSNSCITKEKDSNESFISFLISVILFLCFIVAGGFTANNIYFRIGVL